MFAALCDHTQEAIGGNCTRTSGSGFCLFGCVLLYYDTEEQVIGRRNELGATFTPFEELLQRSDIVTLHVPHTATPARTTPRPALGAPLAGHKGSGRPRGADQGVSVVPRIKSQLKCVQKEP